MKHKRRAQKLLSSLMAVAALLAVFAVNPLNARAESTIKDINTSSDFAKASIVSLADRNIIGGDENGYFHPFSTIKRDEMVKILVNALGIDTENLPETPDFTDVPKDHWAYKYVEAAYRAGIVKGMSPGVFGADRQCTREEMAALFVRAIGLTDQDLQGQQPYLYINRLTDKDSVASWAKETVEFALSTGIMKGTGTDTFSAKLPAQRQQVAVVTDRFLTAQNDINKFAATFKGQVDYPELYNALQENDKKYKGNLDMNVQIGVKDDKGTDITKVTMGMNGAVDADTEQNLMNFDVNYDMGLTAQEGTLINEKFRVIKVGDNYYVKSADSDTWQVKTQQEMEQEGVSSLTTGDSQALVKYYRYGTVTKETNVDFQGTNATKYTISLRPEAIAYMMSGMAGGEAPGVGEDPAGSMQGMIGNAVVYLNDNGQLIGQHFDFSSSAWDSGLGSNVTLNILADAKYTNIGQDVIIQAPEITQAG